MRGTDGVWRTPNGAFFDERTGQSGSTVNGQTRYAPQLGPVSAPLYTSAPKPERGGLLGGLQPTWNSKTGKWDQATNWGNVLSLAAAGGIGLGAATVAPGSIGLPGFGGGGGATSPAASPSVAAVTASGAPTSAAGGTGGVMGFLDRLGNNRLLGTGINALGGWLEARGDKDGRADEIALRRDEMAARELEFQRNLQQQQMEQILNFLSGRQRDLGVEQRDRARMGLDATQMDPYAQAKARNSANVRRSLGATLTPNGTINLQAADLSALSPENLNNVGDYFYRNVAEAQPNVPLGNVSPNAEQFRQGRLGSMDAQGKTIQDLINEYLTKMAGKPVTF